MTTITKRIFSALLLTVIVSQTFQPVLAVEDAVIDTASSTTATKDLEMQDRLSSLTTTTGLSTIPLEQPTKSSSINLMQSLSQGSPFHNLIDYIGYKNITDSDMDAIKWSFILSQLAKPLEESLEDVLSNDLILQMKDINLEISSFPDVTDKDYTYLDVEDPNFHVDSYQFSKVYDTIKSNLRYNKVWDSQGNHLTVKTLYDTYRRKSLVGYISDYIYTNKDNTIYENPAELADKIDLLYTYDDDDKASNLIDYWLHPEKLMKETGRDKLAGQRRLIPIYIGSNITDFYLQLGLMVYCKEHSDSDMSYDKFIQLYGTCEIWADSFGNLVMYDSSKEKYKMILPNSCNPVFSSDKSANSEDLFPDDYLDYVENKNLEQNSPDYEPTQAQTLGIDPPITYNVNKEDASNPSEWQSGTGGIDLIKNTSLKMWNEKSFIYNKWMGATYSIKRRTRTDEADPVEYKTDNEDDLNLGYYPAFVGPIADNRIDYRDSVVMMKPSSSFLHPQLENYVNRGTTLIDKIKNFFSSSAIEIVTISNHPKGDNSIETVNNDFYFADKYLPIQDVLFNTLLGEGTKVRENSQDIPSKEDFYTMWTLAQHCTALITQTAGDTKLKSLTDMDLLGPDRGGGLAQFVYDGTLVDVEDKNLLGDEGGFLKDKKHVIKPTGLNWLLDNIVSDDSELRDLETDYSAIFYTKRDNRISNRFTEYPSDDIAILAYTWLNDYIPKLIYNTYYENGDGHKAVTGKLNSVESSDQVAENYYLLPFNLNTNGNVTYTLTANMLPLEAADEATDFYKSRVDDTVPYTNDYIPCTNHASINSYALLIGLYKNTDSQYNVSNAVAVEDVDASIITLNLANKINYGSENPITVTENYISGIAQKIHAALGIKQTPNYLINMTDDRIKGYFYDYIVITLLLLIVMIFLYMLRTVLKGYSITRGIVDCVVTALMIVSIPLTLIVVQTVHAKSMESLMQATVDRATLITVQQNINGMLNNDALAERRWSAFRQQFTDLDSLYDEGIVQIPTGFDSTGVTYREDPIDALVNGIQYKGATESGEPVWYNIDNLNQYPLKDYYSQNLTYYFYDNMIQQYMNYYKDKQDCDQGLVVSQYSYTNLTDSTLSKYDLIDRLSTLLHGLKGGYSKLLLDTDYCMNNDILGVSKFFNTPITQAEDTSSPTNISYYAPMLDVCIRKQKVTAPIIKDRTVIIPYTPEGLSAMTENTRTSFLPSYEYTKEWNVQPTLFEEKLNTLYKKTYTRIERMLKYRPGEFSDTALMFTASMITANEFSKELCDVNYGPPVVTDFDKLARLIYARNIDDVYSLQPVMYILQDTVSGGSILAALYALFEICTSLVNFLSILICIFVSFTMPIMIYYYYDPGHSIFKYQLTGSFSQVFLNLCILFMVNAPLALGVNLSNKGLTDLQCWIFTACLLAISLVGLHANFKLLTWLFRDVSTAGGSIIASKLQDLKGHFNSMYGETSDVSLTGDSVNLDTNETNMNSEASTINAIESELASENMQLYSPEMEYSDSPLFQAQTENVQSETILPQLQTTQTQLRQISDTIDQQQSQHQDLFNPTDNSTGYSMFPLQESAETESPKSNSYQSEQKIKLVEGIPDTDGDSETLDK